MRLARVLPTSLTAAAVALLAAAGPAAALRRPASPPPVKHVFVIVLENENAATTFGPSSPAPYLARTLVARGAFVPGFYGIGHFSLDNYLAMISGQAPNPVTRADCPAFTEMLPGTPAADGQVIGQGCVYPRSVRTIADQFDAAHLSWKGYMEDMGDDPVRDNGTACAHPADRRTSTPRSARRPPTSTPPATTRSSTSTRSSTRASLRGPRRPAERPARRPEASAPDAEPHVHHAGPVPRRARRDVRGRTARAGWPPRTTFLRTWVPRITRSPAYQRDGLLGDRLRRGGERRERRAAGRCPGPNSAGRPGAAVPGGGRTGAVLLSRFIRRGTTATQQYNHYSLLRSIEDLFGLDHLGYAGAPGLRPFGDDIYTKR